jgi:hypothetical protein
MVDANANADAAWPDGKDDDSGRRTWRDGTTCPSRASGRRRRPTDLRAMLLTAEASPIDATASAAARRPRGPPTSETAPAMANQRRDWFAASERRTRNPSSVGVSVFSTASEIAMSSATAWALMSEIHVFCRSTSVVVTLITPSSRSPAGLPTGFSRR